MEFHVIDLRPSGAQYRSVRFELDGRRALIQIADEAVLRFEHLCQQLSAKPGEMPLRKLVAPRLHGEHTVDGWPTEPTVHPSLSCPACGEHGWVERGVWRKA